jgi:hypothetical protein
VLLDQNVRDTMLASRVARAGEWEKKKFQVIQQAHSLDECLERELGIETPRTVSSSGLARSWRNTLSTPWTTSHTSRNSTRLSWRS